MIRKIVIPIAIVLAATAVAAVFVLDPRQLEPIEIENVPLSVPVVEVRPGPVRLKVHAQGTVRPRTESELIPEVSGNVVWISPNLVSGGYFETGESLLRIDARDYRSAVQRAQAALDRAEADLELAQYEHARAESLLERNLVSQADVDATERTERVAAAALVDASLVLETAQRDLERTELRAPFSGLVRSERVDVGQFVNRGTAIANVYATDYLEIRLPIADQELAYLNIPLRQRGEFAPEDSAAVSLHAVYAGREQTWQAKLVRTEAEIDPGTRMVYAIARLDAGAPQEDASITPPVGLFVQAVIDGQELADVVVLPRAALRNGEYVLVVDSEHRVSLRLVDVLRVYGDEVFIVGGLAEGELVSVSMLQTVVEGMRVQPVRAGI